MTIVPTINASNGSHASLGNLQLQPVVSVDALAARTQQTQNSFVPPVDVALDASVVSLGEITQLLQNPTIRTIITSMLTGGDVVLSLNNTQNAITTSYPQNLTQNLNTQNIDNVQQNNENVYEQLVGISQSRPELIFLADFFPIFTNDFGKTQSLMQYIANGQLHSYLTQEGKYVDAQLQLKNLCSSDQTALLNVLYTMSSDVKTSFDTNKTNFRNKLQQLNMLSSYLLALVRNSNLLKDQFDMRNSLYIVNPSTIASTYATNYTSNKDLSSSTLARYIDTYIQNPYSLTDMLVTLGYDKTSVTTNFSSSKIWLQLLSEYRDVLTHHSLQFLDIEPTAQKNDTSPLTITKNDNAWYFSVIARTNYTIEQVASVTTATFSKTLGDMVALYNRLYTPTNFKTEEMRIAALAHFISKEYRYSAAFNEQSQGHTAAALAGFGTQTTGNMSVFTDVFGMTSNITDFASTQNNFGVLSTSTTSLSSLSHVKPTHIDNVLTFETSYITDGISTYTPGSSFYVDNVLQNTTGKSFDVSNLTSLAATLEDAATRFALVNDALDLVYANADNIIQHSSTSTSGVFGAAVISALNATSDDYTNVLTNPTSLLKNILNSLIDDKGNTLSNVQYDILSSVYALANKNNSLKTALFLFTLFKSQNIEPIATTLLGDIAASIEYAAVNTALVTLVTNVLKGTVTNVVSASQLRNASISLGLTENVVLSAFNTSTPLTILVITLFNKVFSAFKTSAFNGISTRFSGTSDIVIMMVVFDLIITMLAKYNNSTIVGVNYKQVSSSPTSDLSVVPIVTTTLLTYVVSSSFMNNTNSKNDLLNRTDKEIALTQQLFYAVFNTLTKLSSSLRILANFYTSSSSTTNLSTINDIIGDTTLLHMLLSEQQIHVLFNTISELIDRSNVATNNCFSSLENAIITDNTRLALYGTMSSDEFGQFKGVNKRILSIGIPLGFTAQLKRQINISQLTSKAYKNSQTDIVQVNVYKIDVENSDVVFKPQTFLFEMSRFTAKDDVSYKQLSANPSLQDVVTSIPTRDMSSHYLSNSLGVKYYTTDKTQPDAAFADVTYDFLSNEQKYEIAKNHVLSYMLEVYVKLFTGLNFADSDFDINETVKHMSTPMLQTVIQNFVEFVTKRVNTHNESNIAVGALFSQVQNAQTNKAGTVSDIQQFSTITSQTRSQQQNVNTSLSQVSHQMVGPMLHGLNVIDNLSRSLTDLSDPNIVAKKLFSPKKFDRVFNVAIDPDNFEIDYDKTTATAQGTAALGQLIANGDVIAGANVVVSVSGGVATPTVTSYTFKSRDKNSGDYALESYFCTCSSFGDTV